MDKKSSNLKIKVPCSKHSNKKMEYICTNPNCKQKLFCSYCLFKKDYCRHDDYIKELSDFVEEQRLQFEKRGLLGAPEIFEVYNQKSTYLAEYEPKVDPQIKS